MAETEQKIDVGRPRADSMQRRQNAVRFVCIEPGKRIEIQPLFRYLACDMLERLDLGRRQSETGELVRPTSE
jgi:hypothetical protein